MTQAHANELLKRLTRARQPLPGALQQVCRAQFHFECAWARVTLFDASQWVIEQVASDPTRTVTNEVRALGKLCSQGILRGLVTAGGFPHAEDDFANSCLSCLLQVELLTVSIRHGFGQVCLVVTWELLDLGN